jgi:hypothetical protein
MAAKKKQNTEQRFEIKNADCESFWGWGRTPEEAIKCAIDDGCEFTGKVEVYETRQVGTFDVQKKLVATRMKE